MLLVLLELQVIQERLENEEPLEMLVQKDLLVPQEPEVNEGQLEKLDLQEKPGSQDHKEPLVPQDLKDLQEFQEPLDSMEKKETKEIKENKDDQDQLDELDQ